MNSVGSLGKLPKEMDVTGLTVKNCTLVGTANGIRIKTYPASDPSSASEILFQDINMNNVHNPIIIDQNYGAKSSQVLLLFSNTYIHTYINSFGFMLHGLFNWLTCSHLPKKVQNMFGFLHIFLNFLAICFCSHPL